jgi:putative ABC transporter-associated repeat protein
MPATTTTGPAERRHLTTRAGRALAVAALATLLPAAPAAAVLVPSPGPPSAAPSAASSVRAGEQTATGRRVIGDGHIDMGARFVGDRWTIQVRDDTVRPAVWRNMTDVVLHAVDAAKLTVPGDQAFAFLGRPGTQVWVLPQVQRPGVLWPGWNTQDPQVAATVNRGVTWRLNGVAGPGRFVLFVNGEFGAPQVLFNSARPYPQRTGIDLNTHAHGNWVFSAPGTYLLDVEMSARTLAGRSVTDRQLLRVFVGDGEATAAFATAAPPGFAASPAAEPAAGAHGDTVAGIPISGWSLIAGAVGLIVIVVIRAVAKGRRRAASPVRQAPAAPREDG